MRIIAGDLKSRKLHFPKTKLTRPMTDRCKETTFNILSSLVTGKKALDLYAGSGGLGLEALSRGAIQVTFVDRADWAVRSIQRNINELGLAAKSKVIKSDVLRAIGNLSKKKEMFHLIFVDPPYYQGLVKKTLMKLDQSDIVLPFGQVVVGHTRQEELPEQLGTLKLARTKKIGQSCLSFLFRLEFEHGKTKSYISGEL